MHAFIKNISGLSWPLRLRPISDDIAIAEDFDRDVRKQHTACRGGRRLLLSPQIVMGQNMMGDTPWA
jgi:hypothetical protein